MGLALYTLAVSVIYAVLAVAYKPAANALLVLFIALLLVPGAIHDIRRVRRRRRDDGPR